MDDTTKPALPNANVTEAVADSPRPAATAQEKPDTTKDHLKHIRQYLLHHCDDVLMIKNSAKTIADIADVVRNLLYLVLVFMLVGIVTSACLLIRYH